MIQCFEKQCVLKKSFFFHFFSDIYLQQWRKSTSPLYFEKTKVSCCVTLREKQKYQVIKVCVKNKCHVFTSQRIIEFNSVYKIQFSMLRPIYKVRLCRIQQAHDKPTTWVRTYTTIVSELWVWFTRSNSCRRPVVNLSSATKSAFMMPTMIVDFFFQFWYSTKPF